MYGDNDNDCVFSLVFHYLIFRLAFNKEEFFHHPFIHSFIYRLPAYFQHSLWHFYFIEYKCSHSIIPPLHDTICYSNSRCRGRFDGVEAIRPNEKLKEIVRVAISKLFRNDLEGSPIAWLLFMWVKSYTTDESLASLLKELLILRYPEVVWRWL